MLTFVFIVHFSLVLDLQIELISCPIRSVEDVANGIVLLYNNQPLLCRPRKGAI